MLSALPFNVPEFVAVPLNEFALISPLASLAATVLAVAVVTEVRAVPPSTTNFSAVVEVPARFAVNVPVTVKLLKVLRPGLVTLPVTLPVKFPVTLPVTSPCTLPSNAPP